MKQKNKAYPFVPTRIESEASKYDTRKGKRWRRPKKWYSNKVAIM